jgi:hypothetical protein
VASNAHRRISTMRQKTRLSFGDLESFAKLSVPLARVGQPEDYVQLIVFLCGGAAHSTVDVVPIRGGIRM